MGNIVPHKQQAAKDAICIWMDAQGISLKEFAKATDYTYPHAWQLVRGRALLSDEFVGRMFKVYGSEAAQLVSDALASEAKA